MADVIDKLRMHNSIQRVKAHYTSSLPTTNLISQLMQYAQPVQTTHTANVWVCCENCRHTRLDQLHALSGAILGYL